MSRRSERCFMKNLWRWAGAGSAKSLDGDVFHVLSAAPCICFHVQALNKKEHRGGESPDADASYVLTPSTEEKYKKINEEFDNMMKSHKIVSQIRLFFFYHFVNQLYLKVFINTLSIHIHVRLNNISCLYMSTPSPLLSTTSAFLSNPKLKLKLKTPNEIVW